MSLAGMTNLNAKAALTVPCRFSDSSKSNAATNGE
jgi:hypothetical protein